MKCGILVIDDEPAILCAINRCLRRDEYEVHLAGSGEEALRVLAETEVAVIICDQRMPGMSGTQVLSESLKIRPDTFRIMLTGFTDLEAAQKSINEGHVNLFLLKPWDDEHLRRVVAEGVRSYRLIVDNCRVHELIQEQNAELEAWNRTLEEKVRKRTAAIRFQNEKLVELQKQLESSQRDTVGVLANILEMFSPALGIHCKRVARLAREIGQWIEADDSLLRDIEFAAYLHDIGKIATLPARDRSSPRPTSAPRKPRQMTHPEAGHAILALVNGFEQVADAVRHQTERFDGSGPKGQQGQRIPLASRMIALANAYDEAVYSPAKPTEPDCEAGRRVLIAGRHKAFDPQLVAKFLEHLDEPTGTTSADSEIELSPQQIKPGMVLSRDLSNVDGMLLLKAGTELTPELVERIKVFNRSDLLITGVLVECTEQVMEITDDVESRKAS